MMRCSYIRDHAKAGKPFALFLAWGPPHNPYETAPAEYRKMYDPAKIQLRPNVPPEAADDGRKDLAGYYAHCSALDHCIGQLWQTRSRRPASRRIPIIVFTSDHGDMIGSHQMEPQTEAVGRSPARADALALSGRPGHATASAWTRSSVPKT